MPEVIEVCLTALWLDKKMSGKILEDIKVLGGRYKAHTMPGLADFEKHKPFKIQKVDSKGKFLWFELKNDKDEHYFVLNRFGLEGQWGLNKEKHSDVEFIVKNKTTGKVLNFYFTDSRHFGTISITNKQKDLDDELVKLAPDLLKTNFTDQEFHDRIKNLMFTKVGKIMPSIANKPIVKVLMDQGSLGSGLGNYLSVEVAFSAKISPHKKLKEIYENRSLSNKLAEAIRYTLKSAYLTAEIGYLEHLDPKMGKFINELRETVKKDKDSKYNFLPDVKLKKNDKFTFEVYRQKKDPFGNPVKADKIIPGRTTYWSPAIQK
jgi:formamidopyrimidine-DNA glycosylase